MPKKKVLLVEAFDGLSKLWVRQLQDKFDFVVAMNLVEAQEFFHERKYDLVVVACRVCSAGVSAGYQANSVELVQHIRLTYDGPLLVNSANQLFVDEVVEAAGHIPTTFSCHKNDVALKIAQILGEPW